MSPAVVLAGLALLVSLGHLAYALTSSPTEAETTEQSVEPVAAEAGAVPDCRCDFGPVRREVAELRDALALVRVRNRSPRAPAAAGAVAGVSPGEASTAAPSYRPEPSERELEMSLPGDQPLPKIKLFMDIPTGVRLSQRDDGTLEVQATDPEVSGNKYVIYVLTDKGETKIVRFTVP